MSKTFIGPDGKLRCHWCSATPEYIHYHDTEWGIPVYDDQRLFEKLCLESFQSGFSWPTIPARSDNYQKASYNFDINKLARFKRKNEERHHLNEALVSSQKIIEEERLINKTMVIALLLDS